MSLIQFIKSIVRKSDTGNEVKQEYDYSSVESIKAIPIPSYKPLQGICSPVNNVEYILQRKATEFKRQGRMDLAIACLERSNEIMPYSNFSWSADDYMRLVKYLRADKQFARADAEEDRIKRSRPELFAGSHTKNKQFDNLQTDLFSFSGNMLCPYCSIYNGRVFSLQGKDNRFPSIRQLPESLLNMNCPECGVFLHVYSYYDKCMPQFELKADINRSNFPFVDMRTEHQIELYESEKKNKQQKENDQIEYIWICKNLPDIAPKSFSGYRKMKNSNSKNYVKLVESAKALGYLIK